MTKPARWRAACFVANPGFVYAFGHAPIMTKPASNADLRGTFSCSSCERWRRADIVGAGNGHSPLSAPTGSTLVARRAGT